MIKKIEINNVGRFKSYKTNGNEQCFTKNTFIYGNNTFGKSTLTAILRSLKENNPDFIVGRKTLGSIKQMVKIIPEILQPLGEYRYTTDENKWNAGYEDTIIFDNHFVRESVFTQKQQIGQEQQKIIETFMLGAKGIEFNIKISDLTEKIKVNTKIQTSTNAEYSENKHLLGGLSFEFFLGQIEDINVSKKIDKEQNDLDKVKNSEFISGKLKNIKMLLEEYLNFKTLEISEKLSVDSGLIASHFDKHINKKENRQTYGTFLQSGSKLRTHAENECCPFCTQEIKDVSVVDFLNTIDLIYNEKYRKLQEIIKKAETIFLQDIFSTKIQKIKLDLQQVGYLLEINFSDVDKAVEDCGKSIKKKRDDLSGEFDITPFSSINSIVSSHIESIEAELISFTNPVERKIKIEDNLKKLLSNKERYSSWKKKCENYLDAKKENEILGDKKTVLWDEYLLYAKGLSAIMLTDINNILSACNCNFTVQTFSFKGNQKQDLLVLSMDGTQISNDGEPCEMTVQNCLSDSDKWILALAFFLATVKNDPTIKIVVMDDPVSSFDADRKRIILKEIQKIISSTDKQLILLTHERAFYQLLYSENNSDTSATFLKISLNMQTGSDLIVCSPNEDPEFMSEYDIRMENLKNANISNDILFVKNAHSGIRPIIEHILKAKYPLELTKEHITVGEMLTKLEQIDGSYRQISPRKIIENMLTNEPHHDNSRTGQYPTNQLGIEDYKKDIRDAFQCFKAL